MLCKIDAKINGVHDRLVQFGKFCVALMSEKIRPAGRSIGVLAEMKVTIYHNPKCSKSRDALRFLRDAGLEPTIVLYLDTGWTAALLHDLKAATGLGWQEMLRPDTRAILQDSINKNEDAVIIQHVINYPAALERPFVVSGKGTRLCRPIQAIFEIVEARPKSPWLTEKGVPVL